MYHLIYNPVAGKKSALKNLEIVKKILQERGVEFETHASQEARECSQIAKELTQKGESDIIVLGGDGTLHEVLNGLDDPSKCRLGLIPSGTGNDFAEKAGIPLDAEQAILLILDGEAKNTDYLQLSDGRRCMNVGGMGMDVDVLERCHKGKMKGKPKYVLSLLQSLFTFKGYTITVKCEGVEKTHDALIAAVCNGGVFGGGIPICPSADIHDGKMNVVIVDCIGGVFKLIKAFMVLMKGNILEYPLTTHYLCEKVRFTPKKACVAQLDGELYKDLTFDVTLCTGLKIYR
ncbi:MAG: diacylglycerol kinase family lipid kinase [Clostridiales bacterium]|nr:diacylglycerol kinase family lipid kinase [Clostridiales bacterium]